MRYENILSQIHLHKIFYTTEYKAAGRQKEIQKAIQQAKSEQRREKLPEDLCFVSGKYLRQYLHDVALCQQFARLNREQIAKNCWKEPAFSPAKRFIPFTTTSMSMR